MRFNYYYRQWAGIIIGIIFVIISSYLLQIFSMRILLGIALFVGGFILSGLCAYHLPLAKELMEAEKRK